MKTKKLIPLLDYVLEQEKNLNPLKLADALANIVNYAKFLSKPLKLSQFVPCDSNGNILEEPRMEYYDSMTGWNCPEDARNYQDKLEAYNKAKSNVLFEGFEYKKEIRNSGGNYTHILEHQKLEIYIQYGGFFISGKTEIKEIEDLVKLGLTLTENAVKTING